MRVKKSEEPNDVFRFARLKSGHKKLLVVGAIWLFLAVAGGLIIHFASLEYTKKRISDIGQNVAKDIEFDGDTWNLSKYVTNPDYPGSYRLYVFANNGFVVERWRPIAGYLNISNNRYLSRFDTPKTVQTITGQAWRVFSKPVTDNGKRIGVIAVGHVNPDQFALSELDERLRAKADEISQNIVVKNGEIINDDINFTKASPDIPFQIVNTANRIVAKSDNGKGAYNVPDYIDVTYVQRYMDNPGTAKVRDTETGEQLWVTSQPIIDEYGNKRGVVIVGGTTDYASYILARYILVHAVLGVVLAAAVCYMLFFRKDRGGVKTQIGAQGLSPTDDIRAISFDKDACTLQINGHDIPFTYATNQYYLCDALFSARKKTWETDELIEKFGEPLDKNAWRKVYDAVANVNRKASAVMVTKLVVVNNKTYRLNPDLIDKIK